MTSDAILYFQTVPKMIWSLFTSFHIPGLNFTPAVLIFGLLSFRVVLWAMKNVFGLGMSFLDSPADESPQPFVPYKPPASAHFPQRKFSARFNSKHRW